MVLVPRKLYKDKRTEKIVGVSYGSENATLVNEVLFSVEEAKRLKLQDSDIIDYLDLPVIEVFAGKLNMLFPADAEIGFSEDLVDDGIKLTIDKQIIYGHTFNRYSGIEMNNERALQRVLSAHDGNGEEFDGGKGTVFEE